MNRQPPFDTVLFWLVLAIIGFGLLMLTSASSVLAFERFGDSYFFVKRQLFFAVAGLVVLLFFSRWPYQQFRRLAFFALLISLGLLVVVLIPGVGARLLGAQRWIVLGPITFQPAEIVKLTMLIYLATWLDRRSVASREASANLRTFIGLMGLTLGLILAQPDFGTMLILGLIAGALYLTAGAPLRHLLTVVGLAVVILASAIVVAPYRLQRLTVFFNPTANPQAEAYHINQSLIAIGSGGLFGVGLGHSRQKFNYLPEAAGDSIFSVIAEELGFLVVASLVVLYLAVVVRGYRIAQRAADGFGRLLAVGVSTWIGAQALMNIGALSGLWPLTGVPLPLVSYGGTALVVLMAGIGVLLNISRSADRGYAARR